MTRPVDAVETLSRREPVLETLASGTYTRRELVDELDVSRSTVDRAVRELESLGFVERRETGLALSLGGRLALTQRRRSVAALESIDDATVLLDHLPRDVPMSTRMLEGATTIVPEPHAPYEPFEVLPDLIEDATRFRGMAGAERLPGLRELLRERTIDGDLDAECVFTEDLVAFMLERDAAGVRRMIERGGFDIYTLPSIPYGLGVFESPTSACALVVVHEDPAEVHGIIRNDTPAAVEWAEETYRRFRDAATPVDPSDGEDRVTE